MIVWKHPQHGLCRQIFSIVVVETSVKTWFDLSRPEWNKGIVVPAKTIRERHNTIKEVGWGQLAELAAKLDKAPLKWILESQEQG